MQLARILLVVEFSDASAVRDFLNSPELASGRFGDATNVPNGMTVYLQSDGFQFGALGKTIQINYEIPSEYREVKDGAFRHVLQRAKSIISVMGNNRAKALSWIGTQAFLEEIDPKAVSNVESLRNWLTASHIRVPDGLEPSTFVFNFGGQLDGLFQSALLQGVETRVVSGAGPAPPIDPASGRVVNAGFQYVVDVNTKPTALKGELPDEVERLLNYVENNYPAIISRSVQVLAKK